MLKKIILAQENGNKVLYDATDMVKRTGETNPIDFQNTRVYASTPTMDNEVATKRYVDLNGGGGGGGSLSGILTPVPLAPLNNTSASCITTFIATAYRCPYADNKRKHRLFQIKPKGEEWTSTKVIEYIINSDSLQLTEDNMLEQGKEYTWRCLDVSEWGYQSEFTEEQTFTTANEFYVLTPVLNVTLPIVETCTLTGSSFQVSKGNDIHTSTDWKIIDSAQALVWASLDNKDNLLSIDIPKATLEPKKTYTFMMRYKGEKFGYSDWYAVSHTTESEFGEVNKPTPSISGYPDNVSLLPTFGGGSFSVTKGSDKHTLTDWIVYDSTQTTVIWQSINNKVNLTSIICDKKLEHNTNYVLAVRYHGDRCGWSDFSFQAFQVNGIDGSIGEAPLITISDPVDNVLSRFVAFGNYVSEHNKTDWTLVDATTTTTVWTSLNNTSSNLHAITVDYALEPGHEYIIQARYYNGATYTPTGSCRFIAAKDQEKYLHLKVKPGCSYNLSSHLQYTGSEWNNHKANFTVYIDNAETTINFFSSGNITVPNGDIKVKCKVTYGWFPILNFSGDTNLVEVARPFPNECYFYSPSNSSSTNLTFNTFNGCTELTKVYAAPHRNLEYVRHKITNCAYMFNGCSSLTELPLGILDRFATNITTLDYFLYNSAVKEIPEHSFANCIAVTSMNHGLRHCKITKLEGIIFYELTKCTSMNYLCYECNDLTLVGSALFIKQSNTFDAQYAFSKCSSLETVLATFARSKIQSAYQVFYSCPNLKNIGDVFYKCEYLTDVRYGFSLSGVEDLSGAVFSGCTSNFNAQYVFSDCKQLKIISGDVFAYATGIEPYYLNGSSWTSRSNWQYMFYNDDALEEISGDMFKGCTKLYNELGHFFYSNSSYPIKLKRISGNVFEDCINLTTPTKFNTLSELVEVTGDIYRNCGLTSCNTYFESCTKLTKVTGKVFANCDKLTSAQGLFNGCSALSEVTNIFEGCTSLNTLYYAFQNTGNFSISADFFQGLTSLNNISYLFRYSKIEDIPDGLFANLKQKLDGSYMCDNSSIKLIPDNCFTGSNFTNLYYAFNNCVNLSYIPAGVFANQQYLERCDFAFSNCPKLTKIPDRTFYNCPKLTNIGACYYNSGIVTIGDETFANCTAITSSYSNVFSGLNELTTVGNGTYANCTSLTGDSNSYGFSNSPKLTTVGNRTWYGCTNLSFNSSYQHTFYNCPSLKTIGDETFAYCTSLTTSQYAFYSTDATKNIESIGNRTFYGCTGLTTAQYTFQNMTKLVSLGSETFVGCTALNNVNNCFIGCAAIEEFTSNPFSGLEQSLVNANNVFQNCTSLTSLYPEMFSGCTKLTNASNLAYGASLITEIDSALFKGCTSLTSNSIFNNMTGITKISGNVFEGCTAFTSATLSSQFNSCYQTIEEISGVMYKGCSGLTSVDYFFDKCTSLKSVGTVFENCPKITSGNFLFRDCQALENVGKVFGDNCKNVQTLNYCFTNAKFIDIVDGFFTGMSLTSLQYAFYKFQGDTLPEKLLDTDTNTVDCYCICQYANVIELPDDLFGKTRPSNLNYAFDNMPALTKAKACFKDKSALTTANRCFSYNPLMTEVQDDIFSGASALTTAQEAFRDNPSLERVGNNIFKSSGITNCNYVFYNDTKLESIGDYCFAYCTALTDWYYCFAYCKVLSKIGDSLFDGCNNTSFASYLLSNRYQWYYSTSLKSFGNRTFANTALASVNSNLFYDNTAYIKSLGDETFANCTKLTNANSALYYISKLESVGDNTFLNCTALTTATYAFPQSLQSLGSYSFNNCNSLTTASYICNNAKMLVSVGDGTFKGCTYLTDASYSFSNCSALTSIGNNTFEKASRLTNLNYFFRGCTSLEHIPADTFAGCTSSCTLSYLCYNCTSLLEIPDTLFDNIYPTDMSYSFYGTTSLKSIPTNFLGKHRSYVTTLAYAFYQSAVTEVPENTLNNCSSCADFSRMFYESKVKSIASEAFTGCASGANFSYIFAYCKEIPEITTNVFANTNGANFSYSFYYCNFTKVHADVFYNCTNSNADFRYCFAQNPYLTEVIGDVFAYTKCTYGYFSSWAYACPNLTTLGGSIWGHSAIQWISGLFSGIGKVKSITGNLFEYCTNITTTNNSYWYNGWGDVATYCTELSGNILLGCTGLTDARYAFCNFASLAKIEGNLFESCTSLQYADSSVFSGCTAVQEISGAIFKKANLYNANVLSGLSGLRVISGNIFEGNTGVSDVSNFSNNAFNSTARNSLLEISGDIFKNCPNLAKANAVIKDLPALTKLSGNIFIGCTYLSDISNCVQNCISLTDITGNLFEGCTRISTVTNVLNGLPKLEQISGALFKDAHGSLTATECPKLTTITGALYDGAYNGTLAIETITTVNKDMFINGDKRLATASELICGTKVSELPQGIFDSLTNMTSLDKALRDNTELQTLPSDLFRNCTKVTSLVSTFENCSKLTKLPTLNNMTLVTTIASLARKSGLNTIAAKAFDGCTNLTNVSYAFAECSELVTVDDNLFAGCTSITDASYLFSKCTKLTTLPANVFKNKPNLSKLSYALAESGVKLLPTKMLEDSTNVTTVEYFASQSGLTELTDDTFADQQKLTNASYCFYKCPNLIKVTGKLFRDCRTVFTKAMYCFADSGVKEISGNVFENCTVLYDVGYNFNNLSDCRLSGAVYKGCTSISTSNIFTNGGVSEITGNLFEDCSSLRSIAFNGCTNLKKVSGSIFKGCTSLNSVVNLFNACTNLTSVSGALFAGCNALTNAQNMLYGCTALVSVGEIFKECHSINNLQNAFYDCTSLTNVPNALLEPLTSLNNVNSCFRNTAAILDLKITSFGITNANYFAYQNTADTIGTVSVPDNSTTLNYFRSASSPNINIATY